MTNQTSGYKKQLRASSRKLWQAAASRTEVSCAFITDTRQLLMVLQQMLHLLALSIKQSSMLNG